MGIASVGEDTRPVSEMNDIINIYCDESCHLENDKQNAMVLGAISGPSAYRASLGRAIKSLKEKHNILRSRELKWTQVSPSTLAFYIALADLFFDEPRLGFRAVVIPDKKLLDHIRFDQTHDDFYYKMWWLLLTRLIDDQHRFRVFIDHKDTQGREKVAQLQNVLCNTHYDFDCRRILSVEEVRSHDVILLQLADVLIGALSHLHRGVKESEAKQSFISHIRSRTGLTLEKSTPPRASKFNIFIWQPRQNGEM